MNNEKSAAKARIEKLKTLINDYRYHYHVLDESIMSEAAADSLKHDLSQLEEQYPEFITPDSPPNASLANLWINSKKSRTLPV